MSHDKQPIQNIQKAATFRLDGRLVHLFYETPGDPTTVTAVTDTRTITALEQENILLRQAIEAAANIVTQHNLLSTATDEERRAAIARHIEWWNHVALPIIEGRALPKLEADDE